MKGNVEQDFLSSAFTDLMVSLAVIFILLTVVFIRSASQRSEKGKEAVRSSLSDILEKNNLPLKQDPNDPLVLSVSVGEKVLKFALNSAKLSTEGEHFLDGFVPGLAKQLCSEPLRSQLDSVVIEGHTDNSGTTQKNIQLSQSRSFAVLSRALETMQNDPSTTACLLKLASATGRGSSIPVIVNGQYNPDLSRRVEIKIRVKSNDQQILGNAVKNLLPTSK